MIESWSCSNESCQLSRRCKRRIWFKKIGYYAAYFEPVSYAGRAYCTMFLDKEKPDELVARNE